jgi:putative FmdB family regulatory protein
MPIYEYRCDACDETFEKMRRMSDETPVVCPECGDEARKLLSGFAAHTGGGGFSGGGGGCASAGSPSCAPGGG